jgi:hypothetical protein
VRIGVGVWLLALGAILCGYGYWWGVLLVAPAALHFYLAYRLRGVQTLRAARRGALKATASASAVS